MKTLETTFKNQDYTYEQASRDGDVATYIVRSANTNVTHGYEVIKIKKIKEKTFPNGITTPAHEAYPSNEDFGKTAWYYMYGQADKAKARYQELVTEQRNNAKE